METKCSFCNKEYNFEEAEKWKNDSWNWELDAPHTICVKDKEKYALWSKCDDPYYTGYVMRINYCPICGRNLRGKINVG